MKTHKIKKFPIKVKYKWAVAFSGAYGAGIGLQTVEASTELEAIGKVYQDQGAKAIKVS